MSDPFTYAIYKWRGGNYNGRFDTKEELPAWSQPAIALLDAVDLVPYDVTSSSLSASIDGIGNKHVFPFFKEVDYELTDEYVEAHCEKL